MNINRNHVIGLMAREWIDCFDWVIGGEMNVEDYENYVLEIVARWYLG